MTCLLEVERVSAAYGKLTVVQGLSLEVKAGEVHAILGANGAGKTSLLRAISGFGFGVPGTIVEGRIRFDRSDVTEVAPAAKSRLGIRIIPEQVSVFLPMTVSENLRLSRSRGAKRRGDQAELFSALSDLFPVLSERRHERAGLLSGGERQMLGISMALLEMPRLLLIDEASIGLSPSAVRSVFDALRELRDRFHLTMLVAEQNLEAALMLSDYVHVMRAGSIVYESRMSKDVSRRCLYGLMTGEQVLSES